MATALKIQDLNEIYDQSETADKAAFAEFRSNVLLAAGEHYAKRDEGPRRVRDGRAAHETQKLRIAKNFCHKIVRKYKNSILQAAPWVSVGPANETDLQDQKEAELNESVLAWAKERYYLSEKVMEWCDDFVKVGEVCVKIYWDPMKGDIVGYGELLDAEGQPVVEVQGVDEMGMPIEVPVPDETKPVYSGAFAFDSYFAANLLRHVSANNMREAECLILRKMTSVKKLQKRYEQDEVKLKAITESKDEEYVIFDQNSSSYEKSKGQTCVREYYFRPCPDYPEGYFFITTGAVILEEGPLPYGIFPIVWAGFDKVQGTPRAKSILKVARPFIAEINRASSQQALQQLTLGDDKVLYQKGSKLEQGALLPGVRGVSYSGREPTILQGRDGGQFTGYIQQTVQELHMALMLDEIDEEKLTQMDPVALLFRSASQSAKYSEYIKVFERFLVDLVTTFLQLAQKYLPDDMLIPAVGRREMINIAEFRNTSAIHFRIKVSPESETIETKLGKQLLFQNVLQYVGKQLSKEDIGKLLKAMPYANFSGAFDDFTLDSDNSKNDILALDRGEYPPISPKDKPDYMINQLSARQRRRDFLFLDPQIQALYEKRIGEYQTLEAEQLAAIKQAQSEFIPVDGALVKCDIYVQDPKNPDAAPKRATVPQRALEWLLTTLESQGMSMEKMEQMNQGALAQLAEQFISSQSQSQMGAPQMQPQLPQGGMMPFAS